MDYIHKRGEQMSKMAEFMMDFLMVVGEHPEYDKYNWGEDNLPPFEKMWEIIETHRGKKR